MDLDLQGSFSPHESASETTPWLTAHLCAHAQRRGHAMCDMQERVTTVTIDYVRVMWLNNTYIIMLVVLL